MAKTIGVAFAEIKRLDQLRTADQLATSTALTAAEKAVAAALSASEKAVDKAETNQRAVNEGQNEFRATLRDQAANLMPRTETENLIRELRALIASQDVVIQGLRSRLDVGPPSLGVLQARSDTAAGVAQQSATGRSQNQWVIGLVVGLPAALIAIVALVVLLTK